MRYNNQAGMDGPIYINTIVLVINGNLLSVIYPLFKYESQRLYLRTVLVEENLLQ